MPFPGESDAYRQAREELLQAEMQLRASIEAVAAQRRALPLGGELPTDYLFDAWGEQLGAARQVRFSELFRDGSDTLFLYSFMFIANESGDPLASACPSCTSIIDAVSGEVADISQQISFAVAAKVPIEQLQAHAKARGWPTIPLLSTANSTYNRDYQAEDEDGSQLPIANVFVRSEGRIHHFWGSELMFAERAPGQDPRHVDFMWPLWSILDCTRSGRGDWHPSLRYR